MRGTRISFVVPTTERFADDRTSAIWRRIAEIDEESKIRLRSMFQTNFRRLPTVEAVERRQESTIGPEAKYGFQTYSPRHNVSVWRFLKTLRAAPIVHQMRFEPVSVYAFIELRRLRKAADAICRKCEAWPMQICARRLRCECSRGRPIIRQLHADLCKRLTEISDDSARLLLTGNWRKPAVGWSGEKSHHLECMLCANLQY